MTDKEKKLASHMLKYASDVVGNIHFDLSEKYFNEWSLEERKKFKKEYHDYNGDPEEYDETFIHIPDFALIDFLTYKLLNQK